MYHGKLSKSRVPQCECTDQGCSKHMGRAACSQPAISLLRRIDMDDREGTWFCRDCAKDAGESGLYDY